MSARRFWCRRLAGACGLLALGAFGSGLVAFLGELSFAAPAGDLDAPSLRLRLADVSRGHGPAFGPPAPFGARRYANDPNAEGRAR